MPGALVLSRDERTIKKDLIENTSERLRLRTTGEQSKEYRVQSKEQRVQSTENREHSEDFKPLYYRYFTAFSMTNCVCLSANIE